MRDAIVVVLAESGTRGGPRVVVLSGNYLSLVESGMEAVEERRVLAISKETGRENGEMFARVSVEVGRFFIFRCSFRERESGKPVEGTILEHCCSFEWWSSSRFSRRGRRGSSSGRVLSNSRTVFFLTDKQVVPQYLSETDRGHCLCSRKQLHSRKGGPPRRSGPPCRPERPRAKRGAAVALSLQHE